MNFGVESLRDCWNEVVSIASEHWMETEEYRHGQVFNPDHARYVAFEDVGFLKLFTARDKGRLAGYAIMYLSPSMHTQQMIANEDTWFLKKEYRGGRNAYRFYQYVEGVLRDAGVVEIMMTAKLTNQAGRLMEKLGYDHVSNGYSKQFPENVNVRSQSSSAA